MTLRNTIENSRLAKLVLTIGAATIVGSGVYFADKVSNPMDYAESGFVIARHGDNYVNLHKTEGWSEWAIENKGIDKYNPYIRLGNVVEVKQKLSIDDPEGDFLGDTKRKVYDTREEARESLEFQRLNKYSEE
ncbi:MAG: hypothetical protein ACQER9_04485 [Nanobdellota archaeon]